MSLDIAIDFQSEMAEFATSEFQIYFLRHEPEPMAQGQYKAFGQSLLGDSLSGFEIRVMNMPFGPNSLDNP